MEIFCGENAVAFLTGKNGLIDSRMRSLVIHEKNGIVSAELFFSSRHDADYESVQLKFDEVLDFSFYYSNNYVFGNIEGVKLLITDDSHYYLSIDPNEETSASSDNDCDFIKARIFIATVKP